ncbi:MAG: hypothetical protein ACFFDW_08725 [Candidatus Thorarchaeota archaeon]
MRKIQIGVIGSNTLDMNKEQDKAAWDFAYRVGFALGRTITIAVLTSGKGGVSEAVIKGVNDAGGITVSLIADKYKENGNPESHVNIVTTLDSYETSYPFVYSCDCLIAIGGGIETGLQISLAVDLGIHVVIFSKAGGISSEVFTSLEPTFQKMRSSQLVYLVDNADEAYDRAKKFAIDRAKKEIQIDDKTPIKLTPIIETICKKRNLSILLLLKKKKSLTPQEIADLMKIPVIMVQAYLEELDNYEIVMAKRSIGEDHLFSINEDNEIVRKLLQIIFPAEE